MAIKEVVSKNVLVHSISKIKSSQIFYVLSFSILTFMGAQVAVPTQPVPFTLQTMIVLLAGAFLGSKNGAYSQIIYLFAGIIGLPVFAGFSFGIVKLFGPTGGYLLAFPVAAFLSGYLLEKNQSTFRIIIAFVSAQIIILLSGAVYLTLFMNGNFSNALFSGLIIFSIWDVIKIFAAVSIYKAISLKYPKLPA